MKKEILKRMIVGLLGGIAISYIITIIISWTFGDGKYYSCVPSLVVKFGNEINAVTIQVILSAVLGVAFAGASIIWEMDRWSILKQTGLYFGIVTVVMMSVAYVCEWMEHSFKGFICYFTLFFVIFVLVWIVQYIIWKVRISSLKAKIEDGDKR